MTAAILSGAMVIDGTGADARRASVLVEGDRIVAVGSDDEMRAAAGGDVALIDVAGRWVMPGLINAHDHVCFKDVLTTPDTATAYYEIYRQPAATQVLRGARGALVLLSQGVTSVRDAGTMDQLAIEVRDGIDSGMLVGARVASCGSPISVPFEGEGVNPAGMTVDAEGADEMRKMVRWLLERGADYIKVKGHRRDFSSPRTRVYSPEEFAAAIDEAHTAGVRVTLHAWHTEVIEAAVEFGADCVEHGNPLIQRPDLAEGMADTGVAYVPNVTSWVPDPATHDDTKNVKAAIAKEEVWPSTRLAIESGVKVGVGTDLHTARMSTEMLALRSLGMSAMDVLVAATRVGAEILGWDTEVGTIETGKTADLIVLQGDPLQDLAVLDEPDMVFKAGRRYDPHALAQAIGPVPVPPNFRENPGGWPRGSEASRAAY